MLHHLSQLLPVTTDRSEMSPTLATSPDWWGVLAGLHPVLTHFPIALIIVAAGVEFVCLLMRRERIASFTVIALLIGGTSAMFSAWSGWSLADAGYGRGWELELHRWLGAAAGLLGLLLSVLVLIAWFGSQRWATSIVRALSFVCAILIGFAAHFGGELVWGESIVLNSLFPEPGAQPLSVSDHSPPPENGPVTTATPSEASEAEKPVSSVNEPDASKTDVPPSSSSGTDEVQEPIKVAMVSFTKQIEPILDTHCWKCHGPTGRARAGLRLVTDADFARVLDEHPVVSPGSPEKSELYEVITLPRDDDDAMPPGGPGLSVEEVELIQLWIIQGGSTALDAQEVGTSPPPSVPPSIPLDDVDDVEDALTSSQTSIVKEISQLLLARGVPLKPLARESDVFELNASSLSHRIDPPFGDSDLRSIVGLAPVLVELDLSNTEVTDAGLGALVGFDRLRKLTLKGTAVSEESAELLADLTALERLNLFETQMDDSGFEVLLSSSSLRKLYVGSSRVSEAAVTAARVKYPDIDIVWSVSPPISP
ncbi:MAG: hypothetical protein CMJ33_01085 [Phycisphaerae bacterium]|nr:hypothetical protein [Phycisphaerae bacterium]